MFEALKRAKDVFRREAAARRAQLPDRESLSAQIAERVLQLPEFERASVICCYVSVRAEVQTQALIQAAMERGKRVAVPFCEADELLLFHLESLDELADGAYRMIEPRSVLRSVPRKIVEPTEVDLAIAPGVAFDRVGGRLGRGKGHYDRLLARCRDDSSIAGLAFEAQLLETVPMEPHDHFMNLVVTDSAVYRRPMTAAQA